MLLLYRRSIRILFFIFSCPFFWSLRNLCLIVLASHDCPTYHHFGCLWRGGILRIQRQSDAFFYLREQLLASHPDPKQTIVKWLSILFTSQITMLTLLRSDFLSRFEGGVTGEVGSSLSPRRDLFSAVEEPAASSLDKPPPDWSFLFLDCISEMHVKVFNLICWSLALKNYLFLLKIRRFSAQMKWRKGDPCLFWVLSTFLGHIDLRLFAVYPEKLKYFSKRFENKKHQKWSIWTGFWKPEAGGQRVSL